MTSPISHPNVNIIRRSVFGPAGFDRLDAEFVDASLVEREAKIAKLGGRVASAVVKTYDGRKINAQYADAKHVMKYIAIDAVDNEDGLVFPDVKTFEARPSRAKYELKTSDILVSNVRPHRGAIALISDRDAGALGSSGFTLLRDPTGISAEVLFLYFRTHHAREQLLRRNRGSMYPAVLERDVLDLVIPTIPSKLAETLTRSMRQALRLQDRFFQKLQLLEGKLSGFLAPIGVPPSPFESFKVGVDTTEIGRSAAFGDGSAYRLDAEFFRSEYEDFFESVRSEGANFRLGDHYFLKTGRLLPGIDRVATLKQAVLTNAGVNWSALEWRLGKCGAAQVTPGDILLASTAHEIAWVGKKVDYVRSVPASVAACNQVVAEMIVLHPKETKPSHISGAYVAAVLRHPVGRYQVQRCIRGLRGGHTYPQDLARAVLIPDPGPKWLKDFDTVADEAEAARNEAKIKVTSAVGQLETWLESRL